MLISWLSVPGWASFSLKYWITEAMEPGIVSLPIFLVVYLKSLYEMRRKKSNFFMMFPFIKINQYLMNDGCRCKPELQKFLP